MYYYSIVKGNGKQVYYIKGKLWTGVGNTDLQKPNGFLSLAWLYTSYILLMSS